MAVFTKGGNLDDFIYKITKKLSNSTEKSKVEKEIKGKHYYLASFNFFLN